MAAPPHLTSDQQAAVNSEATRSLVIAPAGSGKTEVLIRRIERLLDESRGQSFRVLAVTFTVKAADELKARVTRSIGEEAWRVDADTIHGFAFDWLQRSGRAVGVTPDVVVYADPRDRVDLLRRFLDSVGESYPDQRVLLDVLRRIDSMRTDLLSPEDAPDEIVGRLSFRLPELYGAYLTALDDAGGIDFAGMLTKLLELFELDPSVLRRIRRTYGQILVDEGQDLTQAQSSLLRAIVAESVELFVVADDRQSINGWAGGDMKWARKLAGAGCAQFELQHNFRCATQILSLARSVASHFNPPRADATTPPGTPSGSVWASAAKDSAEEARIVGGWIDDLMQNGIDSSTLVPGEWNQLVPEDIAVVARTRYALDDVQRELEERSYGLSIQVDAGGLLATPEARLFLALLEVGVNDRNQPAWRRVDDELFNLLEGYSGIDESARTLNRFIETVSETPVFPVVDLISRSRFDAEGLDSVWSAIATGEYFLGADLERLLAWWSEYRASTHAQERSGSGLLRFLLRVQQTRSDQPGIRLMTTHRAKGLEFRAVAVVGLTQGSFPDYRSLDNQEDLESERRAFYVSLTRASRTLLLTWPRLKRTRYSERDAEPSQFLKEAGIQT
ncbi:MAG: ATP-dependent helicase [Chloroflexi bacterium]|nr:ATP-dependent helicase [Chloroflexota bacterium]